jgi:hypothetical protein
MALLLTAVSRSFFGEREGPSTDQAGGDHGDGGGQGPVDDHPDPGHRHHDQKIDQKIRAEGQWVVARSGGSDDDLADQRNLEQQSSDDSGNHRFHVLELVGSIIDG